VHLAFSTVSIPMESEQVTVQEKGEDCQEIKSTKITERVGNGLVLNLVGQRAVGRNALGATAYWLIREHA